MVAAGLRVRIPAPGSLETIKARSSIMLVRKAVEKDVISIQELQQRWLAEGSVYGFVPEDEEQIAVALASYLLVEVDGEVVGFLSGSVHLSEGMAVIPAGESYLEIDNLYVLPEFRNRGLGSRLIEARLALAREQGISYALVYSASREIKDILKFYERHNFKSWYIQMFQKL
jgi:GNAT superfamily N-acetyltransferase